MHTRSALVRGNQLSWTEQGDGPALLWAHGLATDANALEHCGLVDWTPLARTHRLVRYDARGHGLSAGQPEPRDFTWPHLAQDLLALADCIQPEGRIAAMGISMGTATILHAAVTAPSRFRALVLTAPPTAWETRRARMSGYRQFAQQLEDGGEATAIQLMSQFQRPAFFAGVPDPVIRVPFALLPAVMRGAAESDLPPEVQLRTLTLPVLVLAWADDPAHPLSTAERLADCIPGARLHIAASLAQIHGWTGVVDGFLADNR